MATVKEQKQEAPSAGILGVEVLKKRSHIPAGVHTLRFDSYEWKDGSGHTGARGPAVSFKVVDSTSLAAGTDVGVMINLNTAGKNAKTALGYRVAEILEIFSALAMASGVVDEGAIKDKGKLQAYLDKLLPNVDEVNSSFSGDTLVKCTTTEGDEEGYLNRHWSTVK